MKKALFITFVIIIALGIGAYYLSTRAGRQEIATWQLVPPNALAVIETERPRILSRLNADSTGLARILLSDDTVSITKDPWLFVVQSLGNKTGVTALIKTSALPTTPIDIIRKFEPKAKFSERSYESTRITDINKDNKPWLSFAEIRGVSVISAHSILIEDIIRSYRAESEKTFKSEHAKIFQLSNVKQDDGNLYINWPRFREITSKSAGVDAVLNATDLCDAMLFDLRWSTNTLLLNGFAVDSMASETTLSLFTSQRPVAFELKNVLPDQFQYIIHFGISNPDQWLEERDRFLETHNDAIWGKLMDVETKTSFNPSEFYKAVDNEIAMCTLPGGEHLIVVELKQITKGVAELAKINASLSKTNQYTHERYANEDLHVLKNSGISQTLFWPLAFDASEIYYTVADNLVVVSDNEQALKKFIDGRNTESTLSKSLEWNKFLESTLQESNVSIFAGPETGDLFGALRQQEKFSMQFYALEGDYYASAIMQFAKESGQAKTRNSTKRGSEFTQKISATPWVVKNHNDKSTETLIVDESNKLSLLSKDQKSLWSLQLPGPVMGSVHQVDLLKNSKLQYLFATGGKLHAVDRLGRYVSGYPKAVAIDDAIYSSVIDYDNSKNYRFLLANAAGKVVVTDLEGKLLEGWNPKNLGRAFSASPDHFRIKQKDYYAALSAHGDLFLFNRRGEISEGFPTSLGFNPAGALVSDGQNLIMVSSDGKLVAINTSGKKASEEAIMKKTANATFSLVESAGRDKFVVVRSDQGTIAAFDVTAKQLFDVPNPASENLQYKLYHFAEGKDVLVVFDKDQGLFYACNLAGKMLLQPQPATVIPAASWQANSKSVIFYVPDQNKLSVISAPL